MIVFGQILRDDDLLLLSVYLQKKIVHLIDDDDDRHYHFYLEIISIRKKKFDSNKSLKATTATAKKTIWKK